MTDNLLKSQAFTLKGRLYTLTVLNLMDSNPTSFNQQLVEFVAKAPRLFDRTPVVLDCSAIHGDGFDLPLICQLMREHGLIPVAIQGGDHLIEALAQSQGLAVVHVSAGHTQAPSKIKKSDAVAATLAKIETIQTKLLTSPVRSGQQVVSKGGDLIVASSVSPGAELLADGNIHVYGALRGRALAGIDGNKHARIFCQSLEAELLSIAGYYRLQDAIEPCSKPCQIFLKDDHIQIEVL